MSLRRLAAVSAFILASLVLAGCGSSPTTPPAPPSEKQKQKELPQGGPGGPSGPKKK
jgi:hypothetical protein